jgi:hypothetical protein
MSCRYKRILCVIILFTLGVGLGGLSAGVTRADSDDGLMAIRKASASSLRPNRTGCAKVQSAGNDACLVAAVPPPAFFLPAPSLAGRLDATLSWLLPVSTTLGAPDYRAPPSF